MKDKRLKGRCMRFGCEHLLNYMETLSIVDNIWGDNLDYHCSIVTNAVRVEDDISDFMYLAQELAFNKDFLERVDFTMPKECPYKLEHKVIRDAEDDNFMLNKSICIECDKKNGIKWEKSIQDDLWNDSQLVVCTAIDSKKNSVISVTEEPPKECPYRREHLNEQKAKTSI